MIYAIPLLIIGLICTCQPEILAIAALLLFPLRPRHCPGLIFLLSGSFFAAFLSDITAAQIFFLRGVLFSLASTFVKLPEGFLKDISDEMRLVREKMRTRSLRENMDWIREQFPPLRIRRSNPWAETLVWALLIMPFLAGFSPARKEDAGTEFIAESPNGIVILTEGTHTIDGAHGGILIEVTKNAARVVEAECPQHRCVLQGEIRAGQNRPIVCMPNRIVIRSRTKARIDGWTG